MSFNELNSGDRQYITKELMQMLVEEVEEKQKYQQLYQQLQQRYRALEMKYDLLMNQYQMLISSQNSYSKNRLTEIKADIKQKSPRQNKIKTESSQRFLGSDRKQQKFKEKNMKNYQNEDEKNVTQGNGNFKFGLLKKVNEETQKKVSEWKKTRGIEEEKNIKKNQVSKLRQQIESLSNSLMGKQKCKVSQLKQVKKLKKVQEILSRPLIQIETVESPKVSPSKKPFSKKKRPDNEEILDISGSFTHLNGQIKGSFGKSKEKVKSKGNFNDSVFQVIQQIKQ